MKSIHLTETHAERQNAPLKESGDLLEGSQSRSHTSNWPIESHAGSPSEEEVDEDKIDHPDILDAQTPPPEASGEDF